MGDHQKIRVLVREVLQATPIRDDITQLHLPGRHETQDPSPKVTQRSDALADIDMKATVLFSGTEQRVAYH